MAEEVLGAGRSTCGARGTRRALDRQALSGRRWAPGEGRELRRLCAGKKWHKRCFTCRSCGKGLDSSTLGEHDGEIFCKTCHSKSFGPTGFGYGVGAGTLRNTSTIAEQFADKAAPAPGPSTETFARPQPAAASSSVTAAAAPSTAGAPKPTGPDICPRCGKKAYMAERVPLARHAARAGASWDAESERRRGRGRRHGR